MMKSKYFGLSAAVMLAGSLVLSGCGGGSSGGGSDEPAVTDTTVTGNAVDGYLRYSTVCLDLDMDGYCQFDSEPYGQTAADGSYSLTVTTAHKANANYGTAKLIVFGGQDSDTGKDFNYKLMAPYSSETSANITPLTTMMAAYMEENSGTTAAQAKAKVATALGLDESDVIGDPVALSTSKPAVLNAALQVQKAAEVIATATTGADTAAKTTEAFKALVAGVATATTATDVKTGVQALITAAKSSTKVDSNKANAIEAAAKAVSDIVDASIGTGDSIDAEAIQKAVLVIDDAKESIETKAANGDTSGYETVTTDAATAMASTTTWQEMLVQSFLDQLGSTADAEAIATSLGAAITAGMSWEEFQTALTAKSITEFDSLIKKRIVKGYLAGQTFYIAHPNWSDFSPGAVAFNADASSAIGQDDENTFTSSVTLSETGFVMSGDHGGTFSGFIKSSDGTYFTATYTNINGTEYLDVRLYLSETAAIAYQGYVESASTTGDDTFDFNEIVGMTVYEVQEGGHINAFIFGSNGSILTDSGDPSVTPTASFGTYTISSDGSSLTLTATEDGETFTDTLTFDSFINEYCMTVLWNSNPNIFCGDYSAAQSIAGGESTTAPEVTTSELQTLLMQNPWYLVSVEPGGAACRGEFTFTSESAFRIDYVEGGTPGSYTGSYGLDGTDIIFDGNTQYPDMYQGEDTDGNLVIDTYTENHERVDQKYFINRTDAIAYGEANGNQNCADYFPAE